MISTTYYHGITRKIIIAFGSIFANIKVERRNHQNVVEQLIDVPVSYGNREKWFQRLTEENKLNERVNITLPRIGFEMMGLQYDAGRMTNKAGHIRSCNQTALGTALATFTPVPYILSFQAYVYSKTQEDALSIIEQIIPYFSPQYVITVNLVPELGIVQDVPINLDGVSVSDSYEGPVEQRREIVYTLTFTIKTEYVGPVDQKTNVILQTRAQVDPSVGLVARQVNSQVNGDINSFTILDKMFDISRPVDNTYPLDPPVPPIIK